MIRLLGEIIIYSKIRDFRLPDPIILTIFINVREFYQRFCLQRAWARMIFTHLKIYIHFTYQPDHSSFQNALIHIFITITYRTMKQNVSVYVWSKCDQNASKCDIRDFGMFRIFCFAAKIQVIYNPTDFYMKATSLKINP